MSSENDALLSQITQLAGQINRHKNQYTTGADVSSQHTPSYANTGTTSSPPGIGRHVDRPASPRGRGWHPYRGAYPPRARGRGGRVLANTHRHRTLVLNNNKPVANKYSDDAPAETPAPVVGNGEWVAKRDRHMQLINTTVYDQKTQARMLAMEKSRQEKLRHRDQHEQQKIKRFLKTRADEQRNAAHEITIEGEQYRVVAGGSKLVRVDLNSIQTPPKTAQIAGVTYTRSKSGRSFFRTGFVRASRGYARPRKQIKEPCKFLSNTGKCKHGMSCPYVHDPDKVSVCLRYLQTGSCPEGDSCDLSHDLTAHRVPACHHFARGHCSNPECRYTHVKVNPAAPICRAFATLGYCEKADQCTERHVRECPDFEEKGVCEDKHCKLQHVERAGRRRAAAAAAQNEQHIDVSSDEDDEDDSIDSDDVDSDNMSEYKMTVDQAAENQDDYIHL